MENKISDLFEQLRSRGTADDGEVNPFAAALTDVVTGGQQGFTNYGGGGGSDH
jgi:hypothetical protein